MITYDDVLHFLAALAVALYIIMVGAVITSDLFKPKKAMQWKNKQFTKENQGAEIVTEIVNDWTYGKDPDHTVIPAIHQRIEGFMVGDKVKIQITKL